MKTKIIILMLLLASVITGCESKKSKAYDNVEMACLSVSNADKECKSSVQYAPPKLDSDVDVAEMDEAPLAVVENATSDAEKKAPIEKINKKKIIKDGAINVTTKNVFESKKNIDEIVKKLNAYYENETFVNNDNEISYDLSIRIPANNFELFISSIDNGKNKITSKNIRARDVTEEYIDLETRLANKKDYLKRYKELLSKASTIKDILAIQENVRSLQEEIESCEGRLKYLSDQVTYSTLNLKLTKIKEHKDNPAQSESFFEKIKDSLVIGWTSIVNLFLWLIEIWPMVIAITFLTFLIRWMIRKRRIKKSK
jgi:hypothetical protein